MAVRTQRCVLNGVVGFIIKMVLKSACSVAHAFLFPACSEHEGMSETKLCHIAVVQGSPS